MLVLISIQKKIYRYNNFDYNNKNQVVGAGGIGAPALLYLAGSGVGKLGIVDFDSVEESNLHRQVIHNEHRINMNKARSARIAIAQFNSSVEVKIYEQKFENHNAYEILQDYDLIIDASDNPKTRYLVNDAAITMKVVD